VRKKSSKKNGSPLCIDFIREFYPSYDFFFFVKGKEKKTSNFPEIFTKKKKKKAEEIFLVKLSIRTTPRVKGEVLSIVSSRKQFEIGLFI